MLAKWVTHTVAKSGCELVTFFDCLIKHESANSSPSLLIKQWWATVCGFSVSSYLVSVQKSSMLSDNLWPKRGCEQFLEISWRKKIKKSTTLFIVGHLPRLPNVKKPRISKFRKIICCHLPRPLYVLRQTTKAAICYITKTLLRREEWITIWPVSMWLFMRGAMQRLLRTWSGHKGKYPVLTAPVITAPFRKVLVIEYRIQKPFWKWLQHIIWYLKLICCRHESRTYN